MTKPPSNHASSHNSHSLNQHECLLSSQLSHRPSKRPQAAILLLQLRILLAVKPEMCQITANFPQTQTLLRAIDSVLFFSTLLCSLNSSSSVRACELHCHLAFGKPEEHLLICPNHRHQSQLPQWNLRHLMMSVQVPHLEIAATLCRLTRLVPRPSP